MKKVSILFCTILPIVSCQGYSITGGPNKAAPPSLIADSQRSQELLTVNSILIPKIEFDMIARRAIPGRLNVDQELKNAVQQELSLKVQYEDEKAVLPGNRTAYIERAKKSGLDGVLITRLHHFVTRQGSAVGSFRPAEVDFTMELIRVKDGRNIWESNYHYRDEALTDNLFHLKDNLSGKNGPSFETADVLLARGYRSALNDLATRRLQQFTAN